MNRLRLSLLLFLTLAFGKVSFAGEVNFSDLFSGAALGADVIIQVPDNSTLVFDGASPYLLERKSLLIRAKTAIIRGTVLIQSFSGTNVGPATPGTPATPSPAGGGQSGTPGAIGATGLPGTGTGTCVLDIGTLQAEAASTLTISYTGQIGGDGQKGGQGGQGGGGASGSNAESDFPKCSNPCPDTGHPGIIGGKRGSGGIGGPGGTGGTLYRSKAVAALQASGAVILNVNGGAGGRAGALGERGIGGPGGVRGAGGNCICNNPPGPGPDGDPGPDSADPTPPPTSGPPGSIVDL